MTKRMGLMLAALAVIFGGIFAYKWIESRFIADYLANYQPPPVAISATPALEQAWERSLRATGTTVAIHEIDVSSEADGVVKAVHFDSGDQVEKGDLLIELDDQVEQANLRSYQARLRLAKLNFDRDSKLAARKLVSTDQFDRSKAELDEVMALSEQTQAVIDQKTVRAPFAGRLGLRRVSVGRYLAAGESAVTLQSVDPIFVDFNFPEQHLPDVHTGQKLAFTIKAFPDQIFTATVTALDARVSTKTRNIAVRALAPNPDQLLVPGMFADVRLNLGSDEPKSIVPETAVIYSLYGQAVFEVLEAKGKDGKVEQVVQRRAITTGAQQDGWVQIEGEIAPGAMIVTNGQNKLQNGMRIKIINREGAHQPPVASSTHEPAVDSPRTQKNQSQDVAPKNAVEDAIPAEDTIPLEDPAPVEYTDPLENSLDTEDGLDTEESSETSPPGDAPPATDSPR